MKSYLNTIIVRETQIKERMRYQFIDSLRETKKYIGKNMRNLGILINFYEMNELLEIKTTT